MKKSNKQFAVIGLGKFGSSVAKELSRMGNDVLAIDKTEEIVDDISDDVTQAVQIDATDIDALKEVGIRNCDVVIVSIGHDVEASILVTVLLKELGIKNVIAKARTSLQGKVLAKVGADRIVFPERDMGVRVAHGLISKSIVDFIEIAPGYSLTEFIAPETFVGKTFKELNIRAKTGVSIILAKKKNGVKMYPGADYIVQNGDILFAAGDDKSVEKLQTTMLSDND